MRVRRGEGGREREGGRAGVEVVSLGERDGGVCVCVHNACVCVCWQPPVCLVDFFRLLVYSLVSVLVLVCVCVCVCVCARACGQECIAAHVCHDLWKGIPRYDNYYFVIDKASEPFIRVVFRVAYLSRLSESLIRVADSSRLSECPLPESPSASLALFDNLR